MAKQTQDAKAGQGPGRGFGDRGWPGDVPKFSYDTSKLRELGWSGRYTCWSGWRSARGSGLEDVGGAIKGSHYRRIRRYRLWPSAVCGHIATRRLGSTHAEGPARNVTTYATYNPILSSAVNRSSNNYPWKCGSIGDCDVAERAEQQMCW